MFKPWFYEDYKFLPVIKELSTFAQLNNKDLVTFSYQDFNDYYNEAIRWNNHHSGSTNTEIRFRLEDNFMTAYLYCFGM